MRSLPRSLQHPANKRRRLIAVSAVTTTVVMYMGIQHQVLLAQNQLLPTLRRVVDSPQDPGSQPGRPWKRQRRTAGRVGPVNLTHVEWLFNETKTNDREVRVHFKCSRASFKNLGLDGLLSMY